MDVSTPTSLMMDFKGPLCPSPSGATAFEFDFINGNFLTNEEDDILTSLYNKQPEDTTFSTIEKSLPDSPDSWVSNSSTSDNEQEDLELCEFTSPENVQKTKPTPKAKQPPVMNAPIAAPFMNFPQVFQPGMMEAFMGQNFMPNMMVSPQQLMFMQQQQIATFNAMNGMMVGTPQFVQAPQPAKKSKSPPVKQERASPSKGATKRRRETPEEEKSPVRDSQSPATSSPSSSPTPDGEQKPEKDKDVKRQRRLIKNRESAQASRERKKIYVQGLEKRVDDLASTNNALNSKVLTLEEENILLREKLLQLDRDGSIAKELSEPNLKKRRLGTEQAKIPIPSLQSGTSINPFTNGFWNAFMSFNPPHMQTGAPQPSGWNPGTQSKKVVLFVMLFCVAVLVFSNRKSELDIKLNEHTTSVGVSRRVGRSLLQNEVLEESSMPFDDSFYAAVRPIMEAFFVESENATMVDEEEEEEVKTEAVEDVKIVKGVSMEFDKDKGLVLTFPVGKNTTSNIKLEEGIEKAKQGNTMDQLSKRFVEEICKQLELQQH